MNPIAYFVVDAFSPAPFGGNPAGVCLLEREFLPDETMQRIAAENNLSETAFVVPEGPGRYRLRWFTPAVEIDLCGHATLGTAHALFLEREIRAAQLRFLTASGELVVEKEEGEALYHMTFPARPGRRIPVTPAMEAAVGVSVLEARLARDLMLVLGDEAAVEKLSPDMAAVAALPEGHGLIVTAQGAGERADFVSRFFAPKMGVEEEPVTGSAHCTLIPYWAGRLGKAQLTARQLSARGGTPYCADRGEAVGIGGRACLYLRGEIRPAL